MKVIQNSSFLEKTLAFIFVLVFLVFAIFFTHSNLEEAKSEFNQKKLDYTKSLAKEIIDLLEKHINISSKLSNVLSENSVAYVVVQDSDGKIVARSEGNGLPVGIFESAEAEAIKAQHIILTDFKDPAGILALVEAAMPIYTSSNSKYILRVGYLRNNEEESLSHIKFRNILVFSLIFIFFISVLSVSSLARMNIRYALIGATTFVMLILFFASAYAIRHWYGPFWKNCFVENECVGLTKMLLPGSIKLIDEKSSDSFEKSTKLLMENKSFVMSSLIKDDVFVYHTDLERIGKTVEDDTYRKSLNSDNPSVFKNSVNGVFYVLIPIMRGNTRIGTIYSAWRNDGGMKYFSPLRDRLTMIFIFAYIILYWFMHLYSTEIANRFSAMARHKEYVTNSSCKTDIINSNSNFTDCNNLVVSIFVYLSGIEEAVKKYDKNKIIESVIRCNQIIENSLQNENLVQLNHSTDGVAIRFYGNDEQGAIFNAIKCSQNIRNKLLDFNDLCFVPKITINVSKLLPINYNSDKQHGFIGGSLLDYKTISKIQSHNDIIISSELYDLLKGLAKCDNLEIISPECGKFNVFCFDTFFESNEIEKKFNDSLDWTKLMILRILKSDDEYICNEYENWAKDASPIVKNRLLEYFFKSSDRS